MAGLAAVELMHSRAVLPVVFLCSVSLLSACAARVSVPTPEARPSRPQRTARVERPAEHPGQPLWRARELLDEALAEGEWRLVQGLPVRSSRLTHLRLTRGALDALAAGERARAVDLLERAIAADGSTGFAYLFLGKLRFDDGRIEQGRLLIEQATALLPDDPVLARQVRRLQEGAASAVGPRIGG